MCMIKINAFSDKKGISVWRKKEKSECALIVKLSLSY